MTRRFVHAIITAALAAIPAATAVAGEIDCTDPPYLGIISGDVDSNVFVPADANCWIQSTAHVDGNVYFGDGTSTNFHVLLIEGIVDGNVIATGPGPGAGLPLVRVGGTVNGNIRMIGAASALDTVGVGATINGNIRADNWRVGLFGAGTTINGNIRCDGVGEGSPDQSLGIFASDVTIVGQIRLSGSGNAVISPTASVWIEGNVRCEGAGSDSDIPLASISGHKFGCPTQ